MAINLVSSLIALIVGSLVAYFEHEGSLWVKPLLFGFLAWVMIFGAILLYRIAGTVPPKVDAVTDENLGSLVRDWFDRYNLTVKRLNDSEAHFSYIVTTPGGKKVTVKRRKANPEYISFSGDMAALKAEGRAAFDALSADEQLRCTTEVKLELSRAVVGLNIPKSIPDGFSVFRELPVTRALTEAQFISEIWFIEAVVNSIIAVNGLTEIRLRAEGKVTTTK